MPLFFPAGEEELFGVFTRAQAPENGIGVLLLSGGAWTPSTGRNRIWVRLARALAGMGFSALRMDYRGVGESTGVTSEFDLQRPFVEDVEGATRWMHSNGVADIALVGTCFGARTALAAASRVDRLSSVVLLATPTRDFAQYDRIVSMPTSWYVRKAFSPQAVRRLFDPAFRRSYARIVLRKGRWIAARLGRRRSGSAPVPTSWVSPRIVEQLGHLVDRRVPVLIVYGDGDDFYADFCRGKDGPLGRVLDRAGTGVIIKVVPGVMHGLTTSTMQEHAIRCTQEWLAEVAPARPAPADVGTDGH